MPDPTTVAINAMAVDWINGLKNVAVKKSVRDFASAADSAFIEFERDDVVEFAVRKMGIVDLGAAGHLLLPEKTAPAGAAGKATLYAEDDDGATRLMAAFGTGEPIQLAKEGGGGGGSSLWTAIGSDIAYAAGQVAVTPTWNDAGGTFTALKVDVTDTASAAASMLLDLQVGGTSKFSVDKIGSINLDIGSTAPVMTWLGGNHQIFTSGANLRIKSYSSTISLANGSFSIFASSLDFRNSSGTFIYTSLFSTGSGVLEQRNGTNAQTFNIYNTYTDASNYERGFARWASNAFEIGTEAAGTGANRNLKIKVGGATYLDIGSSTVSLPSGRSLSLGGGGGAGLRILEGAAPSSISNAAIIYTEDDGAGKTRLMALFPTGAAQQIAIEP